MTRLVTYAGDDMVPRAGVVVEDGVVDLEGSSDGALPASMLAVLASSNWRESVDRAVRNGRIVKAVESVRLLPPIPRPSKVLAVAANYAEHIAEVDRGSHTQPMQRAGPSFPRLFLKPSTCLIGHNEPLRLPTISNEIDWELELALVIGSPASDVAVDQALHHVAGFSVFNDVSARSLNLGSGTFESSESDGFFSWLLGKWPDGFAPMGPWIVTSDQIPDPQKLEFTLSLNRVEMQSGSTADMIFSCAELVSFASKIMRLEPGDVIATGTSAGTGLATGTFLKAGDVMGAEIEGIGRLLTPVVASHKQPYALA